MEQQVRFTINRATLDGFQKAGRNGILNLRDTTTTGERCSIPVPQEAVNDLNINAQQEYDVDITIRPRNSNEEGRTSGRTPGR